MSGVLLQLGAFSDKDTILCGNPEISYFKSMYKKHTYFAMGDYVNNPEYLPSLDSLNKIYINKTGDLLSNICLDIGIEIEGNNNSEYSLVDNFAFNIIDYVEIKIGKYTLDKITSDWFHIYYELNNKNKLDTKLINAPNNYLSNFTSNGNKQTFNIYLPLLFYFCRYKNVPLPITALRTHEKLELLVKLKPANLLYNNSYKIGTKYKNDLKITLSKCNAVATNIFLHPDERKIITQKKHEVLIEQLYHISMPLKRKIDSHGIKENIELNFNNLSKSIFWVVKQYKYINSNNLPNYTIYKNNEINITQFKHLLLNMIQENFIDTTTPSTYYLSIDDNYNLRFNNIIPYLFKITFNENYSFGNGISLKNVKNDITNIFNNIVIHVYKNENLTINNISVPGYYSEREKQLLGNMFNKYVSELSNTGQESTQLFKNLELHSESISSEKNDNIKLFVNVEHNNYSNYYNSDINLINNVNLRFNSTLRTPEDLDSNYYNMIQPSNYNLLTPNNGIYMYTFSLNPFQYYPSGHANFDNFNISTLNLDLNTLTKDGTIEFFSIGYNIFNISNNNFCLTFNY